MRKDNNEIIKIQTYGDPKKDNPISCDGIHGKRTNSNIMGVPFQNVVNLS